MSRLMVLLALLTPAVAEPQAAPQPKANLKNAWVERTMIDLDDNGTPDEVRISASGEVTTSLSSKALSLGGGVKAATVRVNTVGRHRVLVVRGFAAEGKTSQSRAQTLVAQIEGRALRQLWQGATGPQGDDREWSVNLEVTASRLLLYEGRPGFSRCGGARLYQRAYDFKSRRFRPVSRRVRGRPGSPTLVANSEIPEPARDVKQSAFFQPAGITSQLGARSARDVALPIELTDGKDTTAWIEGQTGHGLGETIRFAGPAQKRKIAGIAIIPGHGDAKRVGEFNRLRGAILTVDDKQFVVSFPKVTASSLRQWIQFPQPLRARCVSLTITDVYRGSRARGRRGDTAISELTVFTELELSGQADEELARLVAAGGREGRRAAHALRARGAKASAALVALAAKNTDAGAVGRLREVLASVALPQHAGALVAGLADPRSKRIVRRALENALTRMGDVALPPLANLLADSNGAAAGRSAAVRILSRSRSTEATRALEAALGRGPHTLRRQVAQALSRRVSANDLAALASKAGSPSVEADLWRAASSALGRGTQAKAAAVAAMNRRLETATDYERRYRLLAGLGRHAESTVLARLADVLDDSRRKSSHRADALRRVTLQSLAKNPDPIAVEIFIAALGDPDPGVRLTAIDGLGQRQEPSADRGLMKSLRDAWPNVRTDAASVLGKRCSRADPAASLRQAATGDKAPQVRKAALAGLVDCQAQGTGKLLIAVATNDKESPPVREYSLRLVAMLEHKKRVPDVIALLRKFRGEAYSQPQARRLAAVAATTLGAVGGGKSSKALIEATRDEAYPSIQASAAAALGKLCPTEARAAVGGLRTSGSRQVAIAAKRAWRACRW